MKNTLLIQNMKFPATLAAIFLSTSILSGCSGLPASSNSPLTTTVTTTKTKTEATPSPQTKLDNSPANAPSNDTADTTNAVDASLPTIALSSDLVFKLLSTEIAIQRGQWQVAYLVLMEVAQETRDPRIARRAAEIALFEKQGADALVAVQLWYELAPSSEEATQYYLSMIVLSDQLQKAKPILAQRLANAIKPEDRIAAMYQIQALLARAKDKNSAFLMLENLLSPYRSIFPIETHCTLALAAHAQSDSTRAQAEAHAALLKKPDSELAILTLVQVTPDTTIALQALSDFLQAYPKANTVRTTYGRLLFTQKQYSKAESEFTLLLKTQPQDLTTLYMLGALALQNQDAKKTEKYFTRYLNQLKITPNNALDDTQALLILSQIAEERGDIQTALGWLSQINPINNTISDQNTSYFNVQLKRAQLIAKSGNVKQAQEFLHEINPKNQLEQSQTVLVESQILRNAQRWQESYNVLEAGLQQLPDNLDLLYEYALANEKLAKLENMETALYKIIKLAPNNAHAYNALGYSLAERNIRLDEAQSLLKQALKLSPEDPYIMDSMGWVQFRMGNLNAAEKLLRQAYTLRPDAEIAIHLGEVLWVQGQKSEAQEVWRKIDPQTPQNTILKNTLTRLQAWL